MTEMKKSVPCSSCGSGSGCQCGGGGGCQCGGNGCSKCGDACAGGPLQRPLFFSGQLLTEDDLQLLSDYAAAKGRLHNRYLHGAGVVCGLLVVCHPCGGGKVIVQPGTALDCCGNEIYVPCPVELDINQMVRALQIEKRGGYDCGDPCAKDCDKSPDDVRCIERKGRKYCLYIRYCEDLEEPVTPYTSGSDCAQVCQPTRLREGYRFELRCPEPDPVPDDVIRRIRCCLGDLTRADKASEDALAVDAYGQNYNKVSTLIGAGRMVKFEQADREQLTAGVDTLTPLRAQKNGRRKAAADVDTPREPDEPTVRRMLDQHQSMAAAVARYDLQSPEDKKALSGSMPGIEKDVENARRLVQETGPALGDLAATKLSVARDRVMAETWLSEAKKWTDPNLAQDQIGQTAHFQLAYNVPTSLKLHRQFGRDLSQLRDWLLDRLDGKVLASDCRLRCDVLSVTLPDPDTLDPEATGEAGRRLVELLFRYLIDCICAALNPPCQPCEDSAVKLACLTVENCEVTRICNLERTFVLSGPAMRYWLPFLHTIGEFFERACCETRIRLPKRQPDPQPQPQDPVILRAQNQMRRTTPAYSRIEGLPQLATLYRLANLDAETVRTAVNLGGGLTGLVALEGGAMSVPFDLDLTAFNQRLGDAAVGFIDRSKIKESMLRDVHDEMASMKDEISATSAGNVEAMVNRQMTARLDQARSELAKRLSDSDEAATKTTRELRALLADQQKRNDALERRLAKLEKGG